MTDLVIRPVQSADAPNVARLVTQLGYPSFENEIADRLTVRSRLSSHGIFVAEAGGRVVDLVGAYLDHALELSGAYGRLMGLVVDEPFRGRGFGKCLMEWIEGWVKERAATRLTLTSGKQRVEAHQFYRQLGYEETGLRFVKNL